MNVSDYKKTKTTGLLKETRNLPVRSLSQEGFTRLYEFLTTSN